MGIAENQRVPSETEYFIRYGVESVRPSDSRLSPMQTPVVVLAAQLVILKALLPTSLSFHVSSMFDVQNPDLSTVHSLYYLKH